jgi:hypothetical protein
VYIGSRVVIDALLVAHVLYILIIDTIEVNEERRKTRSDSCTREPVLDNIRIGTRLEETGNGNGLKYHQP